jgi:hypothetical protein
MAIFLCDKNDHWIEATTKPKSCPHCVNGTPCQSTVRGFNEKRSPETLQYRERKDTVQLPPD